MSRESVASGGHRNALIVRALKHYLPILAAALGVTRTLRMRLFWHSDYDRWRNADNCLSWWATRTERMAQLIPPGSPVVEFGAARRSLEQMLPAGCSYIASDLVERGPGTLICDLNKRPLPELRYLNAHVAVFAGVLEYLNDLNAVIGWLSGKVTRYVVSYDCVKSRRFTVGRMMELLRRAGNGYMSYYTETQLIALFEKYGFDCSASETWRDQRLFVFIRSMQ